MSACLPVLFLPEKVFHVKVIAVIAWNKSVVLQRYADDTRCRDQDDQQNDGSKRDGLNKLKVPEPYSDC